MLEDIIAKIALDFENPGEILDILASMEEVRGGPVESRVIRSILFLAAGDTARLRHFVDLYFIDFRDLLWQAEYENTGVRKYDFNRTFGELGL